MDLQQWIADGLVKAYKANEFTRGQVVKLTADYMVQGMITQTNATKVAQGVETEDEARAKAAERPPIQPGQEWVKGGPELPAAPEEPTEGPFTPPSLDVDSPPPVDQEVQ